MIPSPRARIEKDACAGKGILALANFRNGTQCGMFATPCRQTKKPGE
jgi:hypothetical protein